jgi:hypothetical protein
VKRTLLFLTATVAAVWALPAAAQQPKVKTGKGKAASTMTVDTTKPKTDSSKAAGMAGDPDKAVAGGGTIPTGWSVRTDRNAPNTNVRMAMMGTGVHFTLGPAVIAYRASDRAAGPFHTLATFTQTKAPMHPEGYGLFIGGKALDGEGQQYLYFLVRGDGTYIVKQRKGADATTLVDWTASPAVHKADAAGKATNLLEVDQKSDPSKVTFKVNGQPVWSADAKAQDLTGLVGLRVNHNLDVHVDGFALHR